MTSNAHESKVEALLKDISSFGNRTEDVHANEAVRAKLLQTAKRLVGALEKPADAVFHNAFLVTTRVSLKGSNQPLRISSLASPKYLCESGR